MGPPVHLIAAPVADNLTGRALHDVAHGLVVDCGHDRAIGRHLGDQRAKGLLDVVDVAIDIRVIEFDR